MNVVDLFAGIGGIRRGFEQASEGFNFETRCVFTSEWDKYAVKTYNANYPDEVIFGDITQVETQLIPDHDILLAGFPCQPFSQAGKKQGFNDTRGTLFFDIERVLRSKLPQMFLLENVKQLVGHDKQDKRDRFGRTFSIILETLEDIGYKVYWKVLRARDFGLPQNRERVYIVGFLNHNVEFQFPTPDENNTTRLGDILSDVVDDRYTISDKLWEGHRRRKRENKLKGKGFGYSLFNHDSPYANTLSARYYKDGSEILIQQDGLNPRRLTPRECARLQGFPEDFILPEEVSDAQLYRQFGNSVAVNVIRELANEMLKHAN
ncbi:DNA cytosine methyltransferase [Roseivirga sp. E12]|uniref:DNA cytosine methyltransferase n=1 Tax=Roseivirga sp. E12 TaxID=2819237 RepID=UPI001ABCCA64|nr:DNA cytosine methyltransferase [Roseivirga sp. E12]MBO3700195.1 DNA cytosine methyltransferase [Roseivirga sp. E12]